MRTITTKLFAVILLILVLGGITSCTNELDVENALEMSSKTETSKSPYHISLSEAFDHLEATFDAMGVDKTRAIERGCWSVRRIPLSEFKPHTRADGTTEVGDAVYVVNFDNNEGFAILSADSRLPDNVIAVSNSGNLGPIHGPVTDYDNPDTLTLEDLYVPEDDDYLLGSNDPDRVIGGLLTNYVVGWTDSLRGDYDTGEIPTLPINPIVPEITYSYEYETVEHIPEMLTTTWHQDSPFNDQCPERYYYKGFLGITYSTNKSYDFDAVGEWGDDFIREEDLAAGCVAIAVAQILAYNNYPQTDSLISNADGVHPWSALKAHNFTEGETSLYATNIAQLIHKIGVGCDMWYGFYKQQSFATPAAAKRYLESLGYNDVQQYNSYCGVELSIVLEQLRQQLPVFIGAISGFVDGHAWVIDGYQKRNQKKIGRNSNNEIVSTVVTDTNHYVHCNWGWRDAKNNGWFSYGLFDIDDAYSYDNDERHTDELDFDHLFRVITYDKPIQ